MWCSSFCAIRDRNHWSDWSRCVSECCCRMSFFTYSSLNVNLQTWLHTSSPDSDLWHLRSLIARWQPPPPPALFLSKLMIALTLQAFPLLATNLPSDTVWIVWLFCFQQVYWWRTAPQEYYSHCPTAYQNNFMPLLAWDVSCVELCELLWVYLVKRESPCEFCCWCFRVLNTTVEGPHTLHCMRVFCSP